MGRIEDKYQKALLKLTDFCHYNLVFKLRIKLQMWTSCLKWVGNISNHFHAILRPFGRVEKNAFLSDGVYCHKLGCNIILLKKYLGSSLRQRDFSRFRLNLENYFAFLSSSQKGKKMSVFTVQTIFCSIFVEKRGKSKILQDLATFTQKQNSKSLSFFSKQPVTNKIIDQMR